MEKTFTYFAVILTLIAVSDATAQESVGDVQNQTVAADMPGHEELLAECEAGNGSQCAALAEAYRSGSYGEKRDDLARDMFQRACNLDAVAGCNEAGKMATLGKGGGRDQVYAIGAFTRGCDAGDKKACVNIAVQKQHGIGLIKDEKIARAAYLRHCQEDEIQAACHNLASMMLNGQGGEKDEGGLALYRSNCDNGYKASCAMLERRKTESQMPPKE